MVRVKLRKLRKLRGISQTFMSTALGYKHPSGYSNIENGRVGLKIEQAKTLAVILGVTMEEITDEAC